MAGYWKIPIREDDRDNTTITTHLCIHRYNSMPFVLLKSPSTFQLSIYIILSGVIRQNCLFNLHDVILFSPNRNAT